jgi:hypothetical protein
MLTKRLQLKTSEDRGGTFAFCIKLLEDTLRYLMIYIRRYLMKYIRRYLMIYIRRYFIIHDDDAWWYTTYSIHDDSWWYTTILYDTWWYTTILDDTFGTFFRFNNTRWICFESKLKYVVFLKATRSTQWDSISRPKGSAGRDDTTRPNRHGEPLMVISVGCIST